MSTAQNMITFSDVKSPRTFTFTVVFNYLWVDEVYIGYLWTRKIGLGLGLKGLSLFNITDYIYAFVYSNKYLFICHLPCFPCN